MFVASKLCAINVPSSARKRLPPAPDGMPPPAKRTRIVFEFVSFWCFDRYMHRKIFLLSIIFKKTSGFHHRSCGIHSTLHLQPKIQLSSRQPVQMVESSTDPVVSTFHVFTDDAVGGWMEDNTLHKGWHDKMPDDEEN